MSGSQSATVTGSLRKMLTVAKTDSTFARSSGDILSNGMARKASCRAASLVLAKVGFDRCVGGEAIAGRLPRRNDGNS